MIKLSPHFTLREFTKSISGEREGIVNRPDKQQIVNMAHLCYNVLEPIRWHFGKPVTVSSGFRNPEVNKLVRGSKTSDHMQGRAADIEIDGIDNNDIFLYIMNNLEYDQVIAEYLKDDDGSAGWVHVSFNVFKANRNEALIKDKAKPYRRYKS